MKALFQLGFIFFLTLVGNIISHYLPLPIPGSIIGGVILFILLMTKVIKKEYLGTTALFLINHFSLFFIPTSVYLFTVIDDIRHEWVLFFVIVISSTILTFLAGAYTVRLFNKISERKAKEGVTNDA